MPRRRQSRSNAGLAIVCRSVLDGSDPTCVPYDPFGAAPSAGVDQLSERLRRHPGHHVRADRATSTSPACLANMGFKTPWAEDGVGDQRRCRISQGVAGAESGPVVPDGRSRRPGRSDASGRRQLPVWEVFAEAQIPIVQNSFIDELTLGVGYRKSWYELSNGRKYDTDTYKISARSSLRSATSASVARTTGRFALRTSRSCSLRSSSVSTAANDPCAGTSSRRPTSAVSRRAWSSGSRPRRTRPASITACSAATRT